MKKLLLLALTCCLLGCNVQSAQLGQTVPELMATDMNGEPIKLQNWQGKPIFLTFWSSECGSCLLEMRKLETLSHSYHNQVMVIAINIDEQRELKDIDELVRKEAFTYPIVHDLFGATRERYQVAGTPSSFVINPQGTLQKILLGPQSDDTLAQIFHDMVSG